MKERNHNPFDRSDEELVIMCQGGDLDAEEALMRKYKETVKIKAKMYYMAGADEEDIVQEGMIGLLKAIRRFDESKNVSFGTFASVCITSQIISAIRAARTDKHKALNTSVSLYDPLRHENGKLTIADTLKTSVAEDPESLLVIKDIAYYILHNGDNVFSEFEMKVLNEVIKGSDYLKIAEKLGKNPKSVDNAMQRAKKKIVNYIWY